MSQSKAAKINQVAGGSLAEELGLKPEDIILTINEQPIQDLIDYQYLIADENLRLTVLHPNGVHEELSLSKEYDRDLGIRFAEAVFDGTRHCRNRCCFCFIDQLPTGLRPSLYVKDDDYRLSFLQGNFVTLTNLREGDLERILQWHLSPLYVSVHATDPKLRKQLMGNRHAGSIMNQLKQMTAAGITLHLQIVLCPGLNDGPALERTLRDLGELGPNLASVGVVPVGLTQFREQLSGLRRFTEREARQLIEQVERWQERFLAERGSRTVFIADEFYLLGQTEFPRFAEYEEFYQLENGIGLARLFLKEFDQLIPQIPDHLESPQKVLVVTSVLGWRVLKRVLPRLKEIGNLTVNVEVVVNRFFGEGITVTGLLTGQDVYRQLSEAFADPQKVPQRVVLPQVMCKADSTLFLDDWTADDLAQRLGIPVVVAPASAQGLLEAVLNQKIKKRDSRRRALTRTRKARKPESSHL